MLRKLWCGLLLFTLIMVSTNVAFAVGAGGFKNEVVSAKGMGRGSAGAAQIDDPAAVYYNPAAMSYLDGSAVSIGYTLEMPIGRGTPTGAGEVDMESQSFFVPNFYLVDDFGLEEFTFGLGVTIPYGLGTDWPDDSYSRYVATESDVRVENINPSVAYKVNDNLSIGAGLNYMISNVNKYRKFNVTRVNTLLGGSAVEADGDFYLKADDESWGYNLGMLYSFKDSHRLAVAYRSEVDFSQKGTLSLNGLGADATAGLFGASYDTSIKADMTLPEVVTLGYAWDVNDVLTFEADLEWTGWSSVVQDWVEWETETHPIKLQILNAGNPASKDWEDVFSLGIGVNYDASDKIQLRCGYMYEQTPVSEANFDTALPDSDRYGITCGFGYTFKDMTMDISYLALFFEDRDVANGVGSTSNADIDGRYEQFVNIFAVGFTYKY
ncbi:MAG: outer membrane protein transport protein [Candidatus Gorgyraea atricola]|nr:outer membrane protein transport protein [Candidatus Gorgyraea atricola]